MPSQPLAQLRAPDVKLRRVYDEPQADDGIRILVDRLWPRGLSKADAHVDKWHKQIAPSDALRKWFGHDPQRFEEFSRRYLAELQEPERMAVLTELRSLARRGTVTLLTATRELQLSQAAVLADLVRRRRRWSSRRGRQSAQPVRSRWRGEMSR
ncbi:MAG TPA: DUF488 family protein [Mycobacteriales bacterium]|nr:DUF488 family protein [Mycobacteriales bacterium]